jgi:thiamine biosynthesis protein ThiI
MGHIIARYGEISLKGHNRSEFEKVLVQNMRRAVEPWPGVRVSRSQGRIVIDTGDVPTSPVLTALSRVFGLVSLSPVRVAGLSADAIGDEAVALVREAADNGEMPNRTFKVEVRRANKQFPLKSPELTRQLGGRILKSVPGVRVDVHNPDLTVNVEVRDIEAFVYGRTIPGLGGLPVGASGRVGLLLSGGIDSPVAGWMAMKRGAEVEAIHFHSYPFTSERALQKVESLAQVLADWGGRLRLHVVHFTEVQTEIRKHCPEPLTVTIMRRMMMRIATQIARQRGLLALVTGESLGQVASQTLESMHVIEAVTQLPILRPLIAEDKVDIIRRARQIGTYDISILPYEDCCTVFVPKNPRTRPRLEEAERAEEHLDVENLTARAVERTEMKTFHARRGVEPAAAGTP